ncbi:MAG TPA: hypothetical protein V6D00_12010 [Pantanalinema sp.]
MQAFRWCSAPALTFAISCMIGCASPSSPPPGGGGGAIQPTPAPTSAPARLVTLDFEQAPLGAIQPGLHFVDVGAERLARGEQLPSWLYVGSWEVADVDTPTLKSRVLRQTKVQDRPAVTFVRYKGEFAGGPDGQMPARYRMEVTQQPVRSPYNLPPTGDQAIQPYYLDANHYVEVVTTPKELQLWVCDGGLPDSAQGWTKVWSEALSTRPYDKRRIGAVVDTRKRTFQVLYDGAPKAEATLDLIDPARKATVALRAIGNEVNFDDVVLEQLP